MKKMAVTFLLPFVLLCLYGSFARSVKSAEEPKPPPIEEENPVLKRSEGAESQPDLDMASPTQPKEAEKTWSPMDGLTLLMGVFSPLHDEMKDIYGGAFTLSGQYCLNMSSSTDVLASVGFMRKSGDPYYDVPTFSSDNSSTIRIIPLEVSVRRRIALMKSPSGLVHRGFYAGVGINYIRAKEEIPGLLSATGGDFGMQIFVGPQMFFTDNVAFEGEVKLLTNEVDMKYEDERYSITLSGLVIRAGLSWYH